MYAIIKNVIQSGNYNLSDMLTKIDTIWMQSNITDDQRTELVELARRNAESVNSYDIVAKLEELDKRVAALEKLPETPADDYPDYAPGEWYYTDDTVTFDGRKYRCIAPDGVVCVWSPDDYPAYWQQL